MKIGNFRHFFWIMVACFVSTFLGAATIQLTPTESEQFQGTLTIEAAANDLIYADYLDLSIDSPTITLTQWKVNQEPITHFDRSFKDHKKAYKGPIELSFTLTAAEKEALENATIHLHYYQKSHHQVVHEAIPLKTALQSPQPSSAAPLNDLRTAINTEVIEQEEEYVAEHTETETPKSWADYFSHLLVTTHSSFLQLLIIFILGLLMSLTPCIYPMVPSLRAFCKPKDHALY